MKKQILKSTMVVLALAFLAISTTSCNRGMGCPNNFKIQDISNIILPK